MSDARHDWLRAHGPYALGALDEEERASFEAHLATCDICAAEVRELREVAGLLATAARADRAAARRFVTGFCPTRAASVRSAGTPSANGGSAVGRLAAVGCRADRRGAHRRGVRVSVLPWIAAIAASVAAICSRPAIP